MAFDTKKKELGKEGNKLGLPYLGMVDSSIFRISREWENSFC